VQFNSVQEQIGPEATPGRNYDVAVEKVVLSQLRRVVRNM
jgi:hypothetical protein